MSAEIEGEEASPVTRRGGIAERFRGYLPVVVDLETGGFNSRTDALLEVGASIIEMTPGGHLVPGEVLHFHVQPFPGSRLDPSALAFTGIDPHHPFRLAVDERDALNELFRAVRRRMREQECQRAILVAHNASFDQGFINAAVERNGLKRNPFHPFSSIDTVSLSAVAFGQTVLSRACEVAGITFEASQAHSALYDAAKTAELFCSIVNRFRDLGGWPPAAAVKAAP